MKKIILCILDGMGISNETYGNAFKNASTLNIDYLFDNYPHSLLVASGEEVGLPKGQMGNSEVGHTTIGSGRVVYQSLQYINNEIDNGNLFKNENMLEVTHHVKKNNSKLHLIGLLSDGGVHSHINHLYSLLDFCQKEKVERVYLHLFTDGRDVSPYKAKEYLIELENKLEELGLGKIATLSGRYYAMDRDNRYERIELAYNAICLGKGKKYDTALESWEDHQEEHITDEFIIPSVIDEEGIISPGDGIITFNFRPDRLKQLFKAITNKEFNDFERKFIPNLKLVTMMPVSDEVISKSAFVLPKVNDTLGEYLANLGFSQLRIAETEKYAHVTYFFDGGREIELPNCERILIPSSKVDTYDLKPEMSAYEITESLISKIKQNEPDVIILNLANGDMVGHTGNYDATIKAVEAVDNCLGKLLEEIDLEKYTMIITADHGNCEVMKNIDNSINTAHTTNKVPIIITDKKFILREGTLSDVAPTILTIMNLDVPEIMTGRSLIEK